jgi:WD40 repeat protein
MGSFHGRQAEQAKLLQWLVRDRCRLVAIVGMGGQGKSALTAHLVRMVVGPTAQEILRQAAGFEAVLWSSLLNAPPLHETVQSWLQTLSHQQRSLETASLDQQLTLLLQLLRQRRILLVLDNLESILHPGERSGYYRPGYESYGQLLMWLGEQSHQSCLLLTSREEPHDFKRLELGSAVTRSLQLSGLTPEAGQDMLRGFAVAGSSRALAQLVERYSGNPLALKLVAATVVELFGGSVEAFLTEETLVFDDIRDVLDQHYLRLSPTERELMHWLAVEREPIGFSTLYNNLVQAPQRREVMEALRSLQRRSLLEHVGDYFGLQNVIIEYITDHLIAACCAEFQRVGEQWLNNLASADASTSLPWLTDELSQLLTDGHLNRYALVKAQAKEYVRESQVRMLLQPVADWLNGRWSRETVALYLQALLHASREVAPLVPGYLAANLFHLLVQLRIDVQGYNFSQLAFWQVDLRWANLAAADFTGARFANALFLEPFETITALTFTPDGQYLVTGAYNGDICFWRLADRQLVRLCQGHTSPVAALAFHPDGRTLASGSRDCTIRLWDAATGELNQVLRESTGPVVDLKFDQAGARLTSLAEDGMAREWRYHAEALPFERARVHAAHPEIWLQAVIHPGGSLFIRMSGTGSFLCVDRQTGAVYDMGPAHTEPVFALAVSPDGKTLATGSMDQTVRLWSFDLESYSVRLEHVLAGTTKHFIKFAFSPDSTLLAGSVDNEIMLWHVPSGQRQQRLTGHTSRIPSLAFSPDGTTLVSGSLDQTLRLWDIRSGQADSTLRGYTHWINLFEVSPDGKALASSHFDYVVRLWEVATQTVSLLRGHHDTITVLAFSPKGDLLATASEDTTVRLWDVRTGALHSVLRGHTRGIHTLAFHPSGEILVTGSRDYTLHCWDVSTGEHLATLQGHTDQVRFAAFHPDGGLLATSSGDQTIRLWDLEIQHSPVTVKSQVHAVLQGHTGCVEKVAFHPNGRLLASGGDSVRLWDLEHDQRAMILQEQPPTQIAVAFSPDGAWLLSVNSDQTIRIWAVDSASGQCEHRHLLPWQLAGNAYFAFSPDSTTLATVGMDLSLHLWDLRTGQLRSALAGEHTAVTSVRYSPDSRYLYTSSREGSICLWNVQSGQCVTRLQVTTPYAGMRITAVTGITEAQRVALKALGAVEA